MKSYPTAQFSTVLLLLIGCLMLAMKSASAQSSLAPTGPFRHQTISLQEGWNAVYLEVEPKISAPDQLFQNSPIEIVAAYHRPVTAMQFIQNPGEILPDRKTWNVWYAPSREDHLLSNLNAIQAHQCYLIFAKQAHQWRLEGTPFFGSARWHPNAFSLVGFPIDATNPPTVAHFFNNAAPHSPLRIYRMNAGQWSLISQPESTLMQPGAAYWVYSNGASNFMGPFSVHFDGSSAGGLVFSASNNRRTLEIRSRSRFPQTLTLTLAAGENGLIPISHLIQVMELPANNNTIAQPITSGMQIGPLEAGTAFKLDLEVIQENLRHPVMATTLVITSSAGSRIEVPLMSLRPDLLPTP